jgi:hypothetical protein
MDDVRDIVINLVAAAIGAIVASTVAVFRRWRRQRRTRRFWGAMASRGIVVVIGTQDPDATGRWEPSGLVGLGDVMALIAIEHELRRIGCDVRVSAVDALAPDDRERDLVLLGGPDANALTAAVMERYDGRLSLTWPDWRVHAVSIRDSVTDHLFVPETGRDGAVSMDYGLAARIPNPLANGGRTEVLILAGCWGHGTAGAAEAITDPDFLRHPVVGAHRYFEAVVDVAVHANAAHYVGPELVREIEFGD